MSGGVPPQADTRSSFEHIDDTRTMIPAGNLKQKPLLSEQLWEAHRLVEAGQFHDALAAVKDVKSIEPRNIYVLAFEKQLEQLIEYGDANILTDDQRADILESIPGIIERAIDGAAVARLSAERAQSVATAPANHDDKRAALEWLKDQYFQHAHEYVQKGQYAHALAEIRRVYIIDASNKTAKEFEQRIEHLANLKIEPGQPAPAPSPILRLVTKESLANDRADEQPEPEVGPATLPPAEQEVLPVKTEEWSSPAVHARTHPGLEHPPAKRRALRPVVTAVLLLAIIATGATIYLLWTKSQVAKRTEQRRGTVITSAQPETFIGAPTTTEEQNYVVSPATDASESPTPQVSEETPAEKEKVELKKPEAPVSKRSETPLRKAEKTRAAAEKKTSLTVSRSEPSTTLPSPDAGRSAQPSETPPAPKAEEATAPVIVSQAQIIKLERPRFSEAAYEAGLGGQVFIQVEIDGTGKPLQTKVLQSTNKLLEAPIAEAVLKSKFSAAQMTSGPVTTWLTIPFKFTSK